MELLQALAVRQDAQYNPCPEAMPHAMVPTGSVEIIEDWFDTRLYPKTYRDIALYRPAQVPESQPLPVMVFNDGLGYADPKGPVRANQVLDTLIHQGDIPAMAAVFVMPGRTQASRGVVSPGETDPADMNQRSFEYDSLSLLYGEFLNNELLPFAAATLQVDFSNSPAERAICGISSGGICAFNTAWYHPQSFGPVVSHCGSFVNIRGGHNFPFLVRSTPRKSIKVYLTSGKRDGNIIFGNWPLANQQMAPALVVACGILGERKCP